MNGYRNSCLTFDFSIFMFSFCFPTLLLFFLTNLLLNQGLRWGDFTLVMGRLFEDMMGEDGASYGDRPACSKFARWVALAGGRVRRTQRSQLLNEVRQKETESEWLLGFFECYACACVCVYMFLRRRFICLFLI